MILLWKLLAFVEESKDSFEFKSVQVAKYNANSYILWLTGAQSTDESFNSKCNSIYIIIQYNTQACQ